MNLAQHTATGNMIQAYESGECIVHHRTYTHSIIVPAEGEILKWDVHHFTDLTADVMARLLHYSAEIYLLGVGELFQFPEPAVLAPFYQANKSVEMMTTSAACGTFNLLVSEDRKVIAALIV